MSRYDYARAEAECSVALRHRPFYAEALARRADVRRLTGQFSAALDDYDSCLAIIPDCESAQLHRGITLSYQKEYGRAIEDFSAVIERNSSNELAFVHRGEALAGLGEWEAAIADYSRALELAPQLPHAHLQRGNAFFAVGELDLAIGDFSRAVEINPYYSPALVRRAEACMRIGQAERAVADLTDAMRLEPTNARLWILRGEAYEIIGELDRALADFDRAAQMRPSDAVSRVRRAGVWLARGKVDQALADLEVAIELNPVDSEAFLLRGRGNCLRNHFENALADFDRAIELNPTNALAFIGRGNAWLQADECAAAVDDFEMAIQLAPGCQDALLGLAEAHLKLNHHEEAVANASAVLTWTAGASIRALELRAAALAGSGEYDSAIEDLTTIIDLHPTCTKAYHERGRVEFQRGDYQAAIKDLSRAVSDMVRVGLRDKQSVQPLVDRAFVYRAMNHHWDAFYDLTHAVRHDESHSAEYLAQRGIIYVVEKKYNRAMADFSIALRLDPDNEAASLWKDRAELLLADQNARELEQTRQQEDDLLSTLLLGLTANDEPRQSRGPIARRPSIRRSRSAIAPHPTDRDVSESTDFELSTNEAASESSRSHHSVSSIALKEPEESELELAEESPAPSAAETLFATQDVSTAKTKTPSRKLHAGPSRVVLAARGEANPDAEKSTNSGSNVALKPLDAANSESATEGEVELFVDQAAEEEPLPAPIEYSRPAPLDAEAYATPTAKARTLPKPAKKTAKKDSPEDQADRRKRYKRYVIIAIGALFMSYWGIQLVSAMIPPPKNPFKEYTTDKFLAEYAKDKSAGDDKFAGKRISIRGKIKVAFADPKSKATPQIFFEAPGDIKIEIKFNSEGGEVEKGIKDGEEYRINGMVQRYKAGVGIIIDDSNAMPLK